jgi:hypothetical protein
MKLSISIMAVPARATHVNQMISRITSQVQEARGRGFDIENPEVFWDTQQLGPWACWCGAWDLHHKHVSTHHVILQDDLLICADLPETLVKLAQARPEDMLSGFLPRKSVTEAVCKGYHWVRTRRFLWAQCVLLPTVLGDSALVWISQQECNQSNTWKKDDDVRLASWLAATKRSVYVAVPHPIEHIGDELGSTMGHNFDPKKRRAKSWLGELGLGVDVAWDNLAYIRE